MTDAPATSSIVLVMASNYRWLRALAATLVCVGCEGGQTGEPSSTGDFTCHLTHQLPYPGCECRESDWDEALFGSTPRELITQAELRDLPLFWSSRTDDADGFRDLEAKDVRAETRLNLLLQEDPARPVAVCDGAWLYAPVVAKLETADGATASFGGTVVGVGDTLEGAPYRISLAPEAEESAAAFPWNACSYSLGATGTFCHPERGRATWPTPCGGELQLPTDIARDSTHLSPEDFFEDADAVTIESDATRSPLPPITLSLALDDETACYVSSTYEQLEVTISVQTDGIAFSGAATLRTEPTIEMRDVLSTQSSICGDVSASAAWAEVQKETGGALQLCVAVSYERSANGLSVFAEVDLAGAELGFVYTSKP